MVAVESGLFMFPINILIITIFRHIKPRVVANKEESNTIKNKAAIPASVSMNTIIQVPQQFFCNITFTLSCQQNVTLLKVHARVPLLGNYGSVGASQQKPQKHVEQGSEVRKQRRSFLGSEQSPQPD